MTVFERCVACRDLLQRLRTDWSGAAAEFAWPRFKHFNWAIDYFDRMAADNEQPALRVIDDDGADETVSFAAMSRRSSQVANFLRSLDLVAGDPVLISLGNCVALWETMLAVIKLRLVMIPATTLLERDDLHDRVARGAVKVVITHAHLAGRFALPASGLLKITVGGAVPGWVEYQASHAAPERFTANAASPADSPLLLYFTSGTTALPKLVEHSHVSYPVGHLSTMYWIGLLPGDVHLNLSSPGWAKHAWSCVFAPWNAQSCVLAYRYERFDATRLLAKMQQCAVTTFCAPPTVWRMLIQNDLRRWRLQLREAVSAGEPLNAEVIEHVRAAWGLTIRDGFGQTETTAMVANPPGQPVKAGSMGRPLPGYRLVLLDGEGRAAEEGEICIDLKARPLGLMNGYRDGAARAVIDAGDGLFHTGDVARRDTDGYLTYVGRMDDVFKSSDYRVSPFELESVLIEHAAVAEAAVVPSPDPLRLSVPKAFVVLTAGFAADAATARSILLHVRQRVSPYKRIRCIEFADLPKTISGKIRRVELRAIENARTPGSAPRAHEFWEAELNLSGK
jgi:acetyl-CoA synthetase